MNSTIHSFVCTVRQLKLRGLVQRKWRLGRQKEEWDLFRSSVVPLAGNSSLVFLNLVCAFSMTDLPNSGVAVVSALTADAWGCKYALRHLILLRDWPGAEKSSPGCPQLNSHDSWMLPFSRLGQVQCICLDYLSALGVWSPSVRERGRGTAATLRMNIFPLHVNVFRVIIVAENRFPLSPLMLEP